MLASMFLLGAYAAVAQVGLVRELVVIFFGSEVCLGVILACWLAGVAVGAGVGAHLARRVRHNLRAFMVCFTVG